MKKKIFKGSAMLNPVPVVLINSLNEDKSVNTFTVGWIGTACTRPPMISVAIRPERLSYKNIINHGEFVVNLPTKELCKKVDYCGVRSGLNHDKINEMGFTLEKSSSIETPAIKECPVNLECKVKEILPLGSHHLFIAEVLTVTVDEDLIDDKGKIHFEKAGLISYSHGEYFPLPSNSIGTFGYSVKKRSNPKTKKGKG